jgi:N-acetyl sugar amidotransferase
MDKNKKYQMCTRCVMDTTATEIVFDEKGVCNFCRDYDVLAAKTVLRPLNVRLKELDESVLKIKELGKNSKYDCIIGLSGGVDSSYICLWAKQVGLRPLIVHFDNGWNSELAVKNIENIIQKLGFDLYTYVISWEEFKDLQLAYLKASVIDIEVPTDQLIFASLYDIAKKYKIKSIVNGLNIVTEGILPRSWIYMDKLDTVNLGNIHKKFGTIPLKNFPRLGLTKQYINRVLYKMFAVAPLNLLDYHKNGVKQTLIRELGWRDYGGKHYESVFTRFYQGYILLKKFGVDKRKAHLSSMIASGQITRQEALEELARPTYDEKMQQEDLEYVIKKFGLSKAEFDELMSRPPVPHEFYGTQWDKKEFRKHYIFKRLIGPLLNVLAAFRK